MNPRTNIETTLTKLNSLLNIIKTEQNNIKQQEYINQAIQLSTSIINNYPEFSEETNMYQLLSSLYQLKIDKTDYFTSNTTNETSLNTFISLLNKMADITLKSLLISISWSNNYESTLKDQESIWIKYLGTLSEKNKIRYFPGIISRLEEIPELFFYLTANIARLYFNRGVTYCDNKEYGKAKGILHEASNTIKTHFTSANKHLMNDETVNMFTDTEESIKFYLTRSTVNQNIDRGIKAYEEAFFIEETPDRDAIHYAEGEFRDALKELEMVMTDNKSKADIELEAICFGYLGILVYKGDNQKQKGKTYCGRAVQLGLSLMPKNVTNTQWYKTASEIYRIEKRLEEIKEQKEAYEFKEEIKNKYKDEFYDLEEQFPSKGKYESSFIQYVLEKFPYEGYEKIENVKEKYLENEKKMLKLLMVKYAPDKYPKETEDEKKKYVLIEEICKELTRLYNAKK